jgi:hypothetical protein
VSEVAAARRGASNGGTRWRRGVSEVAERGRRCEAEARHQRRRRGVSGGGREVQNRSSVKPVRYIFTVEDAKMGIHGFGWRYPYTLFSRPTAFVPWIDSSPDACRLAAPFAGIRPPLLAFHLLPPRRGRFYLTLTLLSLPTPRRRSIRLLRHASGSFTGCCSLVLEPQVQVRILFYLLPTRTPSIWPHVDSFANLTLNYCKLSCQIFVLPPTKLLSAVPCVLF